LLCTGLNDGLAEGLGEVVDAMDRGAYRHSILPDLKNMTSILSPLMFGVDTCMVHWHRTSLQWRYNIVMGFPLLRD